MIPKFGLLMSRLRQFKVCLCFIFQFGPTLYSHQSSKREKLLATLLSINTNDKRLPGFTRWGKFGIR